MMELDINEVLEQAKKSVSKLQFSNWILSAQVERLIKENEELKLENDLLKVEQTQGVD